jgi:large subunit ribosomal protein L16
MQTIIYKKRHKKKIVSKTQEYVGNIYFGYFGLKAMTTGVLTAKQIETARRVISRMTKRSGKVYIRVFFHHPLTKKPSLSRMGKGVGAIKL